MDDLLVRLETMNLDELVAINNAAEKEIEARLEQERQRLGPAAEAVGMVLMLSVKKEARRRGRPPGKTNRVKDDRRS